ncbi:DUF2889 domain-containing protein [Usitatibacter palustris]|uniref:DUF2889 domain-containing protein n=1 Tax=Usitatibacter palustris TaxID=2732487 RepID=A0A6M4HBL6_9PROT|nr:DUF2889 domain-containing protein [Usitatibacter palustris]QJR16228.1 hypothetical protein DSM104440_03057 [Usitatibacter palustris]
MPLPEPTTPRTPLHRRSIEIRGWKRDDGLFDIEGHLTDTKDADFKLTSGLRPAGEPIHSMWLRLTVDHTLTIVDAAASTDAMPWINVCDGITPEYRRLIGLAIRPGYHQRLKELLGGVRGCTHLTELAGTLATAAFQTMAGQLKRDPAQKPYPIDRCHALDATKPLVAQYYPEWYRGTDQSPPAPDNRQAQKGNES